MDVAASRVVRRGIGHTQAVTALDFVDAAVVSGSGDGTVKLWDARSSECVRTLLAPLGGPPGGGGGGGGGASSVMAVQYDGAYRVVSGSYDKKIRVWDTRRGGPAPLRTLEAHSGAVFCLQFDDAKVVSGSADRQVKIFSFE